jgi:cytochrome P450
MITLAGATVITNIWFGYMHPVIFRLLLNSSLFSYSRAIAHDESRYPKPSDFNPGRFLNPDGTLTSDDVTNIAFGYGRRICVGKDFADVTIWSAMSTILALFKLSLPKDEDGKEMPFEPKWVTGITSWVFAAGHQQVLHMLIATDDDA